MSQPQQLLIEPAGDRAPSVACAPRDVFRFMGVSFTRATSDEIVASFVRSSGTPSAEWIVTANLDHLRQVQGSPEAREIVALADVVVADGASVIVASHVARDPLPERIAGSTMVYALCEQAAAAGRSIYLLGGDPGVADRAAATLTSRFPALDVRGTYAPPFGFDEDPAELERLVTEVASRSPDIVLVALGFPRQDRVIRRLRPVLPRAAFVGVGISLSFVTGDVRRAPEAMQRAGLEWLHRLAQEPRRLFGRYITRGLPFGVRMLTAAAVRRLSGARPQ